MSTIWTFGDIGNKNNLYRGEDSIKKFCESLIEHAIMISNFEKKKIIPLTRKEYLLYIIIKQTVIFAKKSLKINTSMMKIIVKLGTIVNLQLNTVLLHIAYVI